ncbi:hypothetical protein [Pseudophaeobacter sp.]|uniref:hypothetical protein n=1 Tax=Pseudophaeobacter sp. TaxID=1971739 RepID=UPI0032970EE6
MAIPVPGVWPRSGGLGDRSDCECDRGLCRGLLGLRRVFALTPAEEMRPPTPPDYSRSKGLGRVLAGQLDQPSRMVLRQPMRMVGAMVGLAFGMALSVAMITIYAGFDRAIDLTFSVVDCSNVTVTLTQPVSDKTLFELGRIAGVSRVEGARHVPVILRHRLHHHRRALAENLVPIEMPKTGVILSSVLAEMLQIKPGEILTVEVREGRQPVLQIPVAGVAQALLGSPAFMDLQALNRTLREPGRVSGAYLMIDAQQAGAIFDTRQRWIGPSESSEFHKRGCKWQRRPSARVKRI